MRTQFMLDSGAYSAWSTKSSIDIEALIDEARNPQWSSVVALDVIGDHKASAKNTAHMKRAGLKVMPVFHIGDPWELLRDYCAEYEVVGLSKLARLVMAFAMRLQVQERMTRQIADAIQQHLEPCGVAVIVKARHSCMGHRGARQPGAEMITSAMLGCFRDDSSARSEFMRLAGDGEG